MKELYTGPKAELIEFDTKDVILTSPPGSNSILNSFTGTTANEDTGWTGLY